MTSAAHQRQKKRKEKPEKADKSLKKGICLVEQGKKGGFGQEKQRKKWGF